MVRPRVDAPQVTVAEDQEEFLPITAALVSHPAYETGGRPNTHLLAFSPSEEERKALAAGEDIYVALLTFGGPMQGIIVMAGVDEARAVFNVRGEGG